MVLYYIHSYLRNEREPENMLDENVRTDYGKLKFLIIRSKQLNGNFEALRDILEPSLSLFEDMQPDNFLIELKYVTKKENPSQIERLKKEAISQLSKYEKNIKGPIHKIVVIAGSDKVHYMEEA